MRPSLTPSFASHASIAAWLSIASFAAGTAAAGSFSAGTATTRSHACRCVWKFAGAPAMIASKSSGYFCASIRPWRPPVEQPFQYESRGARS